MDRRVGFLFRLLILRPQESRELLQFFLVPVREFVMSQGMGDICSLVPGLDELVLFQIKLLTVDDLVDSTVLLTELGGIV